MVNLSTVPPAPETATGTVSGAGETTERQPWSTVVVGQPRRAPVSAVDHALNRATRADYHQWLTHVFPAAGCTHPIRLAGETLTVEAGTGRLLTHQPTEQLPDGVIYKPCGNRRTTVCPGCAEVYRRDAYELIRTGLVGGKGVPDSVASHPAVFVTLTAPSFGPVHTRRTTPTRRVLPCRPRRQPAACPHGVDLRCHRRHREGEPALGTPLCLDCYGYAGQVVWNHHAGELWRRTRIALDRATRRATNGLVKLRYAKVAEMQRRGVVHFHLVIRADGHHPDLPGVILPPPAGLTAARLQELITTTVPRVGFTTEPHPRNPTGWRITWGEQLDIRPIRLTADGELTDRAAAGYLAKYATKSTEATGHTSRRLNADTIDLYADPTGTHTERLIAACWTLGTDKHWIGLRRWAHMLGYGGHFLTKARAYSVTFGHLRQLRTTWRRAQAAAHDQHEQHQQETTLVINWLTYAGAGWKTTGDALLANTAAALARERRAAREELSHS